MTNPAKIVSTLIDENAGDTLFRGVLLSVAGGLATLRRDGSNTTEGPYPTIDSPILAVGDEVLVARVGTGYVVVGRIRRGGIPATPIPAGSVILEWYIDRSSAPVVMTTANTKYDATGCTLALTSGRWLVFCFEGLYIVGTGSQFTGYIRDSANTVLTTQVSGVGGMTNLTFFDVITLSAAATIKPSASCNANDATLDNAILLAVKVG